MFLGDSNKKWIEGYLNRNSLKIITGFITGHCRLRKLHIEQNSMCCFDKEKALIHLLINYGPMIYKKKMP